MRTPAQRQFTVYFGLSRLAAQAVVANLEVGNVLVRGLIGNLAEEHETSCAAGEGVAFVAGQSRATPLATSPLCDADGVPLDDAIVLLRPDSVGADQPTVVRVTVLAPDGASSGVRTAHIVDGEGRTVSSEFSVFVSRSRVTERPM